MDDLYRQELMEIYKNPSHKGYITDCSVSITKKNPMCGDTINLDLTIEFDHETKNHVIKDAKFNGESCSVSIISADLLIEDILEKSIDEVKRIDKDYLLDLIDMNLTTSRVKCAELILIALQGAIKKFEEELKNDK